MSQEIKNVLKEALVELFKNPNIAVEAFSEAITEAFGSRASYKAKIREAILLTLGNFNFYGPPIEAEQVMGEYNVNVIIQATPAEGEWLSPNPKCYLYRNNSVLAEMDMEMYLPYGSYVPDLWIASFIGVYPKPNFTKVDVSFMNEQYNITTVTDVKEII